MHRAAFLLQLWAVLSGRPFQWAPFFISFAALVRGQAVKHLTEGSDFEKISPSVQLDDLF